MSNHDSPTPPAPAAVCERLKQALGDFEVFAQADGAGDYVECRINKEDLTAALLLIEQGEKERERVDWLLEKGVSINVSGSGPGYGFAYTRLFPSRQAIDAARAQPTPESK